VINPAFYALRDSRTPMFVSLASILVNFAVAATMLKTTRLGHAGLALSTSAVAIFGAVALFLILRKRIGGIHGRALFDSLWRISTASIAMGGVVWCTSAFMESWLGGSALAPLADRAVSIPVGLAVFCPPCHVLRVS